MNDVGGIENKIIKECFEAITIRKSGKNREFETFYNEAGEICFGDQIAYKKCVLLGHKNKKANNTIEPKHEEKVSTFEKFERQDRVCFGDENAYDKANRLIAQVEDRELV